MSPSTPPPSAPADSLHALIVGMVALVCVVTAFSVAALGSGA